MSEAQARARAADHEEMPTNEDFPRRYLEGPPRDPRTGAPEGEDWRPLTDSDRELRRLLERERWVGAISVPPPGSNGNDAG